MGTKELGPKNHPKTEGELENADKAWDRRCDLQSLFLSPGFAQQPASGTTDGGIIIEVIVIITAIIITRTTLTE